VSRVTWPNFQILGLHYNFWMNQNIRFKTGTEIEDWPFLRRDHKATSKWAWPWSRDPIRGSFITFERIIRFKFGRDMEDWPFHKWAWSRSRDPILKFWDPLIIFQTNQVIRYKFGTEIEDWAVLRMDQWACPESCDPIYKFWGPLITSERIKLSVWNLVQT